MSDFKKIYRVKASASFDYHAFKQVRLEISVGQDYYEGAKLKACIDWAVKNFENVVILVGDTLNRHNLMRDNNLRSKEAFALSRYEGDQWLKRNKAVIPETCQIIRWQHFLYNEGFFPTLNQARQLYKLSIPFQHALDAVIMETADRKLNRDENLIWEDFKQSSLSYLLEETAGLAIAYELFPGVSAYHGSYNEMWSMFVDQNISDAPQGLRNSHCIRIQTCPKRSAQKKKLAA